MVTAEKIIERLGGPETVAKVAQVHRTRVYDWRRGGTGGTIPLKHHKRLLDYARANDIPLSAEELIGYEAA